jgi:hypothetical protein
MDIENSTMPRHRTPATRAAGKLVSTIQKVWGDALGTDSAPAAESVMYRAHDLMRADSVDALTRLLDGRSCAEYLGAEWVRAHPSIWPALRTFESIAFGDDPSRFSAL